MTGETPPRARALASEPGRRPLVPSLTPAVVTTRGRRETQPGPGVRAAHPRRERVRGPPRPRRRHRRAARRGAGRRAGATSGEPLCTLCSSTLGAQPERPPRHPGRAPQGREPPDLAMGAGPGHRRLRRLHPRVRPRLGPPLPGRSRRRQPLLLREPPCSQLPHARPHRGRAPRPRGRPGPRGGSASARSVIDSRTPSAGRRTSSSTWCPAPRSSAPSTRTAAFSCAPTASTRWCPNRTSTRHCTRRRPSTRRAGSSCPSRWVADRATTSAWPRSRWDTSPGRLDLAPDPFVDWRTALSSRGQDGWFSAIKPGFESP